MERQVTRDEAANIAGVKPDTFSNYVARGRAPAPVRHIGRTPLWDAAKVEKWQLTDQARPHEEPTKHHVEPPSAARPLHESGVTKAE